MHGRSIFDLSSYKPTGNDDHAHHIICVGGQIYGIVGKRKSDAFDVFYVQVIYIIHMGRYTFTTCQASAAKTAVICTYMHDRYII